MLKFIHIVGTRPNFMKLASLINKMNKEFTNKVVHTGQHFDANMSDVFFEDLDLEKPDYNLNINSGDVNTQIGNTIIKLNEIFKDEKPDGVIVYGDVNATLSGALAANKLDIPLIHVESGSRSFDKRMPEEINRVIVDHISDILLGCDYTTLDNLKAEGIYDNIHIVGNTAIDTFHDVYNRVKNEPNPIGEDFVLCTLHRPSNVDDLDRLKDLIKYIGELNELVIFPAHPRVSKKLETIGVSSNIKIVDPFGYKDFVKHLNHAKYVISDSGGVQCESAILRKRLFTMRDTTEHTLTVELGSNKLCYNPNELKEMVNLSVDLSYDIPYIWNGKASERIIEIIKEYYEHNN